MNNNIDQLSADIAKEIVRRHASGGVLREPQLAALIAEAFHNQINATNEAGRALACLSKWPHSAFSGKQSMRDYASDALAKLHNALK